MYARANRNAYQNKTGYSDLKEAKTAMEELERRSASPNQRKSSSRRRSTLKTTSPHFQTTTNLSDLRQTDLSNNTTDTNLAKPRSTSALGRKIRIRSQKQQRTHENRPHTASTKVILLNKL